MGERERASRDRRARGPGRTGLSTSGAAVALVALLVATSVAGPLVAVAAGQAQEGTVVGRPDVSLSVPDNRLESGTRTTVQIFVSNAGDIDRGGPAQFEERVTTARNVRMEVERERLPPAFARNVEVRTGQIALGTLSPGLTEPVSVALELSEGLPPGTYEVPVEVSYEYTRTIQFDQFETRYQDATETERETVTLVVEPRARFDLTLGNESVSAGDETAVPLTVTNVGEEAASDATVSLSAGNGSVFFGDGQRARPTTSVLVGSLGPGESRTVPVRVGASDTTPAGDQPITAVVRYDNPAGVQSRSDPATVAVAVAREQTFAVDDVTDTLRVGADGSVRGTVVNTGPRAARDAVVVLAANESGFRPRVTEYAVGTLEPGETAPFQFGVAIANTTDPGPRQLSVQVRYRNRDDEVRTSDGLDASVTVDGEQTFAVENATDDLRVDGTGQLNATFVNTGAVTVRKATVVVTSTSPTVTAREREYAVGTVGPGERVPFGFTFDVTNRSEPGPRQFTLRVRYSDENGDRQQSDPLRVAVSVGPEQTFAVRGVRSDLRVDAAGNVTGAVVNTGNETVTEAVLVVGDNPTLRAREREYALGTLRPGERAPFQFTMDVANGTDAGPRQLSFRVRYRDAADERRRSDLLTAPVDVATEPAVALRSVESGLRVGTSGTVSGRVVNTGSVALRDAVVVLRPGDVAIRPREREFAVGTLAPGEAANVSFTADVNRSTEPGPRQVSLVVRYRDRDGRVRTLDPLDARVAVAPEQSFAVRNASGDLRVGDAGDVTATIVNTGGATARNAVVVLQTGNPNLVARETEYAVGPLAPGESADVSYTVDVTGEAEAGPRQVSFVVRYRDRADDQRRSDPIDARVVVGHERDEFSVVATNATVPRGSAELVTLRVTNVLNGTVTDVEAKLFANDPLSATDDEAFVASLAPGESTTLVFEVSAAGAALLKDYPVSVDFSYEDARGDDVLSDTYRVPVTVTAREGRGFPFVVGGGGRGPLVLGGAAVGAVLVVGVVWWKREAVPVLGN